MERTGPAESGPGAREPGAQGPGRAGAGGDGFLDARRRRANHGGVWLRPDEVPPARRRYLGVVVPLLALVCMSAGFASAKLWDGRLVDHLSVDQAVDVMNDASIDPNKRLLAQAQVFGFAKKAIHALADGVRD